MSKSKIKTREKGKDIKVLDKSAVVYSSRIKARSSFGKEFYQWRKNDVITKAAF